MSRRWLDIEDEVIRNFYSRDKISVIANLVGRTREAVMSRASKLKIKAAVKTKPIKKSKAKTINNKVIVKKVGYRQPWTKEEDYILNSFYLTEGRDVCFRLPSRCLKSIYKRACELGLVKSCKKWTSYDDFVINNYYSKEGWQIIFRLPGRKVEEVVARAKSFGFKE